jgi:DNA-directed RNA polymerase specialized sigma24 family protein
VGRLYDTHGGALYRYAAILLADPAAAEDAVQQVFAALVRRPVQMDDQRRYLRRAALDASINTVSARYRYALARLREHLTRT